MRQSKCADISPTPPMHWRTGECADALIGLVASLAHIGALAHFDGEPK